MFELRVMQQGFDEKIHAHVDYELFLVLAGEASVDNGPVTTRLRRDAMFFINSNVKHKCRVGKDSVVLSYQISYGDAYKTIALPYIIYDITPTGENVGKLAQLRKLLKNIATLTVRGATLDNIKIQSLAYEVMHLLVRDFSNWSPSQLDNNAISRENRLQMILDYIINNAHSQLSLQHLSDKFGLSVLYLSKYIKRALGMGFNQYLNNIRLHNAVDDLIQTARPVTQIAYDNGFTNLTSFNRLFRAAYQCSPSEYRKSNAPLEEGSYEEHTAIALNEYLVKNPFTLTEDGAGQVARASFDVPGDPPRYFKNWNVLLTFGAAHQLLDSRIQEQVLMLCKSLGFSNLRIWGLFSEENSIDKNSQSNFNFTKLNQIFDFFYNNNLIPFIDLGFQAEAIYGGLDITIRYRETDIEFTELSQYQKLLTHFLKNAINRYGMDYVRQWKFELWKDPRLPFEDADVTFFRVFDVAYEAIKKVLPESIIGGCGLPILGSVADFEKTLKIWEGRNIQPDFYTVALFPYHAVADGRLELSQDEDYLTRSISRLKASLHSFDMEDKRLYINGWNLSRSSRNSINDSCYKAAYIVRNTIRCLGNVDGIAYNGTTDLQNEHFDTTGVLSGGLGLLTKDGIKKPAFYAYQFLNRLGSRMLAQGENYVATQDHDDIIVLCHNCVQPGLDYYLHHKDNVKPAEVALLFEDKNLNLVFSITLPEERSYLVKKYRLNRQAGSVLDIWLQTGMSETADKEDIQFFQAMAIPHLSTEAVQSNLMKLNYKTELETNEIQLLHFRLQA